MIDIHNHIIFGVDDGSKSIEESLNLIAKAKAEGFTDIVLTPHFMKGAMDTSVTVIKERFQILKKAIKEKNIDMNLYLGHELYLDPNLIEDLKQKRCLSIHKTDYVLMELPLNSSVYQLESFVYELKIAGYKVILAHPERYTFIQNDINALKKLMDEGVLSQLTLSSLKGYYGKVVEKTAKKMVKKRWVHFIGTDVHREKSSALDVKKPIKYMQKKGGKTWFNQLSLVFPQSLLKNEDLPAVTKKKPRKSLKALLILAALVLVLAIGGKFLINKVEEQFESIMIEQAKAYKIEKDKQEAAAFKQREQAAEEAKQQREVYYLLEKEQREAKRKAEDLKRLAAIKAEEEKIEAEEKKIQEALKSAKSDLERKEAEAAAAALKIKKDKDRLKAIEKEKEIEAMRLEEERLAEEALAAEEARINAERLEVERLIAKEKAEKEAALAANYSSYETDKAKAMSLALSKLTVNQVNDLIKMSSGGFTPEEKTIAKAMFYNNFTASEQEWILEMYALYYGG